MERAKTLEERKQEARDRYFNKYCNEPALKVILQRENEVLREEIAKLDK